MTKYMKGLLIFVASLLIILPLGALAEDTNTAPGIGITGTTPSDTNLTVLPPSINVNQESSTPGAPPQGIPDPSAPSVQFTPPPDSTPPTDPSSIDPSVIPSPFDPSVGGVQEPTESIPPSQEPASLPKRATQGFFSSAWFLIILIVLMISAYLIYVALTEGKWPLQKHPEVQTKKTKKTRK
jgi:hypothetical protein